MKKADTSRIFWLGGLAAGVAAVAGVIAYEAMSSAQAATVKIDVPAGQTYTIKASSTNNVISLTVAVGGVVSVTADHGYALNGSSFGGSSVSQTAFTSTGVTYTAVTAGTSKITVSGTDASNANFTMTITITVP